jgi:two-component system cell cycle sensor histidine kinase/response regulator CckA
MPQSVVQAVSESSGRRLTFSAIGLIAIHTAVVIIFRKRAWIGELSDLFVLAAVFFSAFVCFYVAARSYPLARTFWYLAGSTLALWTVGKCIVAYDQYVLGLSSLPIIPLLIFFLSAAPLFVAIFTAGDLEKSAINWEWIVDAIQILILTLIVYLFLVYVPSLIHGESFASLIEDRVLLVRNVLLALGLLARGVVSRLRFVRRLYLPMAIIMGIYAWATWVANRVQSTSAVPLTSLYDLAWSGPFCLIAIHASLWKQSPDEVPLPGKTRPRMSGIAFAYLPALILPGILLMKRNEVAREQVVLGLVGLILSIVLFNVRLVLTQRRQRLAVEALNASEKQYKQLFERNLAGVYQSTIDGRLLDCNPAFANMLGYTRGEFDQIPMSALYFGGVNERTSDIAQIRSASHKVHEICFRRKNGSPVWVAQNANIEQQSDGSEIVEGIVIDITERKLSALAIEDWKHRYDAAVIAAGQIIYERDPVSQETTYWGALRDILGCPQESAMDTPSWRALIHPEDLPAYLNSADRAKEALKPFDCEYRVKRQDGTYRIVREQGRVSIEGGKSPRVIGFITDVTERRTLEAQLRQAQKLEALGRLAGGVAHDFNNLLTVIGGYSGLQLAREDPSSPVYHEAEQIKAAADRASALTRQLLAFSRQQVLQPRRVNLNDIVRNSEKMLRRLIGEDVEVMTVFGKDIGTVKVDPGQIDQVLMNLVVNARDAMPDGGKLTISTDNIELAESYVRRHGNVIPGRYVMLAVSDNGLGMDVQTQARIFEPFFTTKEPGKGTGLGLPMAYGTVKQSGGYIEVYSESGHGTTVKIYLPRVDAAVEEISAVSAAKLSEGARGSERILLVEDDAQLRKLVATVLTERGYTVEILEDLQELEKGLQNINRCDLLLTDVVMPKMNGPAVARIVAQQWRGIKTLYVSGYTTDAIVHHGVLDQQLNYLQKPFTPEVLATKVREVLDGSAEGAAMAQ